MPQPPVLVLAPAAPPPRLEQKKILCDTLGVVEDGVRMPPAPVKPFTDRKSAPKGNGAGPLPSSSVPALFLPADGTDSHHPHTFEDI